MIENIKKIFLAKAEARMRCGSRTPWFLGCKDEVDHGGTEERI